MQKIEQNVRGIVNQNIILKKAIPIQNKKLQVSSIINQSYCLVLIRIFVGGDEQGGGDEGPAGGEGLRD